jgi:UDP-N-acetylglucosamine:LPS N-acetylglucosamine transferase
MRSKRILAVASTGGHWVQLRRLHPVFEGHHVAYVTTDGRHAAEVAPARLYSISDGSRSSKLALLASGLELLWIMVRERPDIVMSTGAAPGYLAIRLGRLLGARTVWIDSFANVEELSLSGRLASQSADLCLTQWPHLAGGRVEHRGAVL